MKNNNEEELQFADLLELRLELAAAFFTAPPSFTAAPALKQQFFGPLGLFGPMKAPKNNNFFGALR